MNALQMPDMNFDKELSKCKNMENLVGKNGLMQRLFGGIIQQFLEAEMEEAYSRHTCICRLYPFYGYKD